MASYPEPRWTNTQPTFVSQPQPPPRGTGKDQTSPLLVPVQGYESIYPTYMAAYPNHQVQPRPKRRKFCIHLGFLLLFSTLFYFYAPKLFSYVEPLFPQGFGHSSMAPIERHPDCVQDADWTPHDPDIQRLWPDEHYRHLVLTSFRLPLDSELLYLIGNGALVHGAIDIVDDGDPSAPDVLVDVSLLYHTQAAFDMIQVCRLHQEGTTKNGLGFFSPSSFPPHHGHEFRTNFYVTVHLPKGTSRRHIYEGFQTDLPIFTHNVADISESALFRSISLQTSNSPIRVQSIAVENGRFKTINAHISGKVAASKSLELLSANGPLEGEITLTHQGDSSPATKLSLSTINSAIRHHITLVSGSGTGGSFDISAETKNSPIDIRYPSAPVDSVLNFDARSVNAPVSAALHETYEGSFNLKTSSWFSPSLKFDSEVPDPSGQDRKRRLNLGVNSRGRVQGTVQWGLDEKQGGSVTLSTVLAKTELKL